MSTQSSEFQVPAGYTEDIGNPLEGEGIRLPFAAPYLWWQNGRPQLKQQGGAPYFGGWAMSDVDMAQAAADHNDALPLGWISYEMINDEGEDYIAFMSRIAYLAILGSRFRWLAESNKGQYQVLAYMAYPDQQKNMVPFCPVVLTCKGTAGMFLRDAVINFSTKTAMARRQLANNLPVSAFYCAIGTFAATPVIKSVGKQVKKQVTPLSLWLPEKIDGDFLRRTFIGSEVAKLTVDLRKEAADWLGAWKVTTNTKVTKPVAEEPEFSPEPPVEDDMPF